MKKTSLFILCLSLLTINLLTINALAQAPTAPISGGVVNGKARSLAKPAYPPAAKAVRASGAVNVQVLIDEEGNVISATAVSGHPLLRAAAEQAARDSKFSPTMLQGVAVKVRGIIVYNFVAPETPMSWANIGYSLSKADASNNYAENLPASSIAATIPADWIEEKGKANALAQKQQFILTQKRIAETMKNKPSTSIETVETPKRIVAIQDKSVDFSKINEAEIVRELIPMLQNRLLNDEVRGWYFNFGTVLGKTDAMMNNQNELRENLVALRQVQAVVPSQIPASVLTELQNFIELAEKGNFTAEENDQMRKSLARLAIMNF